MQKRIMLLTSLLVTIVVIGAGILFFSTPMPLDRDARLAAIAQTATFCAETTGVPVMLWEMFGSPTPSPSPEGTPVQPTPTLPSGNATRGQTLFHGDAACSACHVVDSGEWYIGPSLMGIADRAGTKKPGMTALDYLYAVIQEPDANIVPQTRPGIMPRSFARSLTTGQIADLIAYLMTLRM